MMMRLFTLMFFVVMASQLIAQPLTTVSDFENIQLEQDSFLNGSNGQTEFESGHCIFPTNYSTDFGGFWAGGWAISNMTDTQTGDFTNLYSAKPGIGQGMSENYAVGQQGAKVYNTTFSSSIFSEIYLTNSTYAYEVIKNGNDFSKKFGGETGDDPDYFRLIIEGWYEGELMDEQVEFYLADYRFEDNAMDYIVDDWTIVNIGTLGIADSIRFTLESTDTGDNGINTPLFFCMDNVIRANLVNTNQPESKVVAMSVQPNPAKEQITVDFQNWKNGQLQMHNSSGQLINTWQVQDQRIDIHINDLSSGIYFLRWTDGQQVATSRFIKE